MQLAHFAVGWLAFVAWTVPVFVALEVAAPRRRAAPRWRAIALSACLLGIDAALARMLVYAPPRADLARALAALVLAELLLYGVHRAMHAVPALWRFHRLHHVREPLAWHVAWRSHPIDAALFAAATALACAIAGAPLPAAVWFVVGRRVWTVVLHANVAWCPTAADAVLATPAFHHRHHREDLAPANFAGTFALIDRVFGTWAR